jgi:hypothetical protein
MRKLHDIHVLVIAVAFVGYLVFVVIIAALSVDLVCRTPRPLPSHPNGGAR